jgi:hypothetical protein
MNLSTAGIKLALDLFYQDPLNARVTITSAMMILATEDLGNEALAKKMLQESRQNPNQEQHK